MLRKQSGLLRYLLFALFIIIQAASAFAATPKVISYSGTLSDNRGVAVNANVITHFALYKEAEGGTPVWSETQTTTVTNGTFTAILGSINPLNVTFDTQYWLGVSVGSDSEMTPRQMFSASPYAIHAATADNITLQCADGEILKYDGSTTTWKCAVETSSTGLRGPPGADGAQGPAGPAGIAGKTILNGVVPPVSNIGTDGDHYINTTTNTIYGPKAGGTWPAGVSLVGPAGATGPQGPQGIQGATGPQGTAGVGSVGPAGPQGPQGIQGVAGPAGANGKTVLNGVIPPADNIGTDGDHYINTATNTIYGPKAGGTWPAGVSLIGPTGATGATGPQGPQGIQGVAGVTGPAGPAGPQGIQGVAGPTGPAGANGTNGADGKTVLNGVVPPVSNIGTDGDHYINTATNTIYGPKAGDTWPAGVSLVGPTGATGPQGPQGIQGVVGPAGATGATGSAGPQGIQGVAGATGATGPAGANGTNGTDGKTVLNGVIPPADNTGTDGDHYINTATNTIYGPKAGGTWPAGVSLVGPAGATGPAGPQGIQGVAGPAGAAGATGPAGANGTNGTDGKTVLNGVIPPADNIGTDGDHYINTATNTIYGPKAGGTWPAGVSLVGPAGATGPAGPQGIQGVAGPQGPQGPQGVAQADGVVTTGSYADPAWLATLAGSKISGAVASATTAGSVTNGVVTTGSYADPAWLTSLAGSKISGSITVPSYNTSAANGTHYVLPYNSVAFSDTPTEGMVQTTPTGLATYTGGEWVYYERVIGNPATDGHCLKSTAAGVRSWGACLSSASTTDIEVTSSTAGLVLKSPGGNRYRITVNDAGTLTATVLEIAPAEPLNESFSDASLDTSKFHVSTSGSATITEDTSLHITAAANSGIAGLLYKIPIKKAANTYTLRIRSTEATGGITAEVWGLPNATPGANPGGVRMIFSSFPMGDMPNTAILYQNSAAVTQVLYSTAPLVNNTFYDLILETTSSTWRYRVKSIDGSTTFMDSGVINWTNTIAVGSGNQMYLMLGNFFTGAEGTPLGNEITSFTVN